VFSIKAYASPADAEASLTQLLGSFIRPPLARFTILEARIIEPHDISGLPGTLIYEERSDGPKGLHGTRLVAGTVDNIVFDARCSALGEPWPWPWDEVMSMATIQINKIRRMLAVSVAR
jgi:hypothetical protein